MALFPHAVLKLVWDSRGPSLGSMLILEALGCSRTSWKESTGLILLPHRQHTGLGLGPCDQCEVSRAGGRLPRPVIRVSLRQPRCLLAG